MENDDDLLQLSGIQHFSFCRRQWALIHVEKLWSENGLTAAGRVQHERVHDRMKTESRGDELIVRGMPIKSRALGVSGECDAVVFSRKEDGVILHGRRGKWLPLPVEYKHGREKVSDCDRLQAAAQAMCLEEMFSCRFERAALYYFETKHREYFDVTDELRERVTAMFAEMRQYAARGYTPKVKPSAACRSCSLREDCLPVLLRKKESVADYCRRYLTEEEAST